MVGLGHAQDPIQMRVVSWGMQGVAMMPLYDYLATRDSLNFGCLWEAVMFETDGLATDSTIAAVVDNMINTGLVVEVKVEKLTEDKILKALHDYATGKQAYPAWVGKLIRTTTAAWTPVAWGEKEVLFQCSDSTFIYQGVLFQCSDSTLILVEKGRGQRDGSTIFHVDKQILGLMNPILPP
jgi:hypothetical protein